MMKLALLSIGLAAVLPAMTLAAGMATVTNQKGETGHVYWQKETIVVSLPARLSPDSVMLTNDNVYFVYAPGRTPRVIEMSEMARSMVGRAQNDKLGRIAAVEATGKTETIAGIEGHVYRVTVIENGESTVHRAVLTDNPTVVELTRLVLARGRSVLANQSALVERVAAALPETHGGVLAFGERFRFTRVTSDNPPDKWFQLPAEPTPFARAMIKRMADRITGNGGTGRK